MNKEDQCAVQRAANKMNPIMFTLTIVVVVWLTILAQLWFSALKLVLVKVRGYSEHGELRLIDYVVAATIFTVVFVVFVRFVVKSPVHMF